MTARVTITYPVPAEDMPLVQFMAGNAPGTGPGGPTAPTDVPGSAQYLINGVVSGPPLLDFQSRLWSLTAGPPPDVLLNGFGNWTATNAGDPPTQLLLASDHNVYMLPAIGIWKHYDSDGTWRNGTPPTAAQPPAALPPLPTHNPIAPGSGAVIQCANDVALNAAIKAAQPGQKLVLATGTYTTPPPAIMTSLQIDCGGSSFDGTGQDGNLAQGGAGWFVVGDGGEAIIENIALIKGVGMSRTNGDLTSAFRVQGGGILTLNKVNAHGNQCAIGVSAPGPTSSIVVVNDSDISGNGLGVTPSLTHNAYINGGSFTFSNLVSTEPTVGYALKMRGWILTGTGGAFAAGPGAKPFDVPDGLSVPAVLTNVTVTKGATDNDHGILSYGADGTPNGTAGITFKGGAIAALCQSPFISGPVVVTLSGVALTGNLPIAGQQGAQVNVTA